MRAFAIPQTEVKRFMGQLLKETRFDDFAARSAELTLAVHIAIDGKLEEEPEEVEETAENKNAPVGKGANGNKGAKWATWAKLRPMVYDLVRNGGKPRFMKFVFSHGQAAEVHPNAAALFLNLTYEHDRVSFTTATAQREFALDKSLDEAWDAWVQDFFAKSGIGIMEPA